MTMRPTGVLVAALAVFAACSSASPVRPRAAEPTTAATTTTTAPPAETTTATTPPPPPPTTATVAATAGALTLGSSGADLAAAPGGTATGHLRAGVVLPVDAVSGGWAHITTPCDNKGWVRLAGRALTRHSTIVLDAGHGGNEPGAVGPTGLTEKELNLAVAQKVVAALHAQGIDAALDRTSDYRATLGFRAAVADALKPAAFVSLHHNSEPDGPRAGPGSETYFQVHSAQSKRLAGLIYEEVVRALGAFSASWVADTDAGAKWRTNDRGGDYYGILRLTGDHGVVASLAELAFLSNATEEALLRRDDVRQAEADAVARGILRYLRTSDPGSGFTTPYPRTEPAGGGGGRTGCTDPS
jgi:N-acetylmuramoyl-L-alanine amidase